MTLISPTQTSLLEWRFNGTVKNMWIGNSTIEIPNVSKEDEGIYECYDMGHREQGRQGIMRLIVRGRKCKFSYSILHHNHNQSFCNLHYILKFEGGKLLENLAYLFFIVFVPKVCRNVYSLFNMLKAPFNNEC